MMRLLKSPYTEVLWICNPRLSCIDMFSVLFRSYICRVTLRWSNHIYNNFLMNPLPAYEHVHSVTQMRQKFHLVMIYFQPKP